MTDGSIRFYDQEADDSETLDPALEHLPHLPGLPSVWFSSIVGRGQSTVHVSFADCAHNTDAMPGLPTFLLNIARTQGYLHSIEICPELLPHLEAVLVAHPQLAQNVLHFCGHVGEVMNRVLCLFFLYMVHEAGDMSWAKDAYNRSFAGDGEEELKKLCQDVSNHFRCGEPLPDELWSLGQKPDEPATD